ncbi:Vacuolar protein sorting-associated protein [Sesamum angolense]|uniref:Vacuolar protein sorting-associated protein n=1 Tax=Sesamum angolense TaxID=2727404 RepID=A0AAE1T8F4_9LAMI|nr:Vacuolar protein sorting-associated protein [Sesamum angolense]
MRRRPGIGGLQNAAAARDQYRLLGENVAKLRTDLMKEQLATFRSQLEDFARKHKNDIRKNPAFRSQFHEMCAKVGVDPLASNKGFWAELLGIGDFYYELGVQIVDICLATRPHNGGLISLEELCKLLGQRRRGAREAVSQDDCLRAISKLKVLGNGFEVISIGKKKLVRSVPTELNKDHNEILELAQVQGFVTVDEVQRRLSWSSGRATDALETLLEEGLAMIDDGHKDGKRRVYGCFLQLHDVQPAFSCMVSHSKREAAAVSGVWNRFLDNFKFFLALEVVVFRVVGVRPRSRGKPNSD